MNSTIKKEYALASERYAKLGVSTSAALSKLKGISLSLHCWQGDDVSGFEKEGSLLSGGIQVTGNRFGKARSADELRNDLEKALSLLPGKHRVNLHAIYGNFTLKKNDRDQISKDNFIDWVSWAKKQKLKLDFNATLFSHPKSESGFTLSSKDVSIRSFWVEHVKRCRDISAWFGQTLGSASVHNLWIADGMKDQCADKRGYREALKNSLDKIFSVKISSKYIKDAVESKLFGIGSESFVVGSQEFYTSYALKNNLMLCLDMGHFHPTESIADKISAILTFQKEVLIHVSRGVRWDSDHVVLFDDATKEVAAEVKRNSALETAHFALDYFDASINRIGAWVIGARAAQKSILYALLEPTSALVKAEESGDYFKRLALTEELKAMPFGSVWNYFCEQEGVPSAEDWIKEVELYEKEVLSKRS
ncbi:MAG: L-rhamnose isomerase [Candidatus Firestonebacteria bacterium RIFOXYA2_FULL_40_8]|nr:MAG: L-rhamnose isomerase [Candidatus Firestonebacteria bacterium RIFOXYA2_FULL_40_8]